MNDAIRLDRGDVAVEPLPELFCTGECEPPNKDTHAVTLDMRNIGVSSEVFRGCLSCCEAFADALRDSLSEVGDA